MTTGRRVGLALALLLAVAVAAVAAQPAKPAQADPEKYYGYKGVPPKKGADYYKKEEPSKQYKYYDDDAEKFLVYKGSDYHQKKYGYKRDGDYERPPRYGGGGDDYYKRYDDEEYYYDRQGDYYRRSEYPRDDGYGGGYKHGDPDRDHSYGYYPKPPPVCPFCPSNLTQCGTQCLDLSNNPFSCGTCGFVCQPNSDCIAGVCTCATNLTQCNTTFPPICTDLSSDVKNCGSCNKSCNTAAPTPEICVAGNCVPGPGPCKPGESQCIPGPGPNGCVNLKNNSDYCGSCNRQCKFGLDCNDGKCCTANDKPCLFDVQCCGWSVLSLVDPAVPTSKCEGTNIFNQKCCKGVNSLCTANDVCCGELECRSVLGVGICQVPPSCVIPGARCVPGVDTCCAGLSCQATGILGNICR